MRTIIGFVVLLLVVAACGGEGTTVELEGGATIVGDFETRDGMGPGEVIITLTDSGTAIESIRVDAGMDGYVCPAGEAEGEALSGGGYTLTLTPGLPISGDSFDNDGFAGTFTSPTEVSGTYDLNEDHDCDEVVTWSATKQ